MRRTWLFRIFPPAVASVIWVLLICLLVVLVLLGARILLKTEIHLTTVSLERQADSLQTLRERPDQRKNIDLPDTILFCGRTFPIYSYTDSLLLRKAMAFFLDRPHLTYLCLTSLSRYRPFIEKALVENGLPQDLKFVPLVESYLDIFVRSPEDAVGYWQFVPATGRKYGLVINKEVDERRDPILSTKAAGRYFDDLFEIFGDWPLVLAAYNAGDKRIQKAQHDQGYKDYSLLNLPQETRNYVYYIVAVKVMTDHPEKYHLLLRNEDNLKPLQFDTLTVEIHKKRQTISELAARAGVSVQAMRDLNPSFLNNEIPKGRWTIRLPLGTRVRF